MSPISQTALDGLKQGIQAELAAYVFYKKGITIVEDAGLKEILSQLASEEKNHYQILERQFDNLVRTEMWVAYNDIMRRPGLPDIDEKTADVHNELIDRISSQSTPRQILEIALTLEIQARDLYESEGRKTRDAWGKEMYSHLTKFENSHVVKIQNMMKTHK